MRGGHLYGRFFSETPGPPYGCSLEDARGCGTGSGHRKFVFTCASGRAFSFNVGCRGACSVRGKDLPLANQSPYIYAIEPLPDDPEELKNLLLGAEKALGAEGACRLLLCTEAALSAAAQSAAGLTRIGTYSSTSPSLSCRIWRPKSTILQRAVAFSRKKAPSITSAASGILSASPFRKYVVGGRVGGKEFRIMFNCPKPLANYYSGAIFGPQSQCFPKPFLLAAQPEAAHVEVSWHISGKGIGGRAAIPSFTRLLVEMGPSFEEHIKSLGGSAGKDIKKIRKNGLTHRLSSDVMDFMLFYHKMYLPMIRTRHGRHPLYVDFEDLFAFFRSGFLILIVRNGCPIAALLAISCGKTLVGKTMGILAGLSEHTFAGANAAVIYYSIQCCYENGYNRFDMGYSSPFGCDGVFKFKSKWGAKVVADRGIDLLSLNFRDKGAREDFFSSCSPFLLETLEQYDPPKIGPGS